MRKLLLIAFLTALVVCVIVAKAQLFNTVKAATNVSGIISSGTTWTKANSPYTLTGNILVNNGVTLTIEAGAVVNLNGYYIMVNGTLRARGTSIDRITFSGAGRVSFAQSSTSWNEQTGSGSIIENANLDSIGIGIASVSPKISGNSILQISVGGSPLISHNTIIDGVSVGSDAISPIISYNTISGEFRVAYHAAYPSGSLVISHNTINNGLTVGNEVGSLVISYNTISGGVKTSSSPEFSYNNIEGEVVLSDGSPTLLNNTITGGVSLNPQWFVNASILNNVITAGDIGVKLFPSLTTSLYGGHSYATISGNAIFGCKTAGIQIGEDNVQAGHTAVGNNATIERNVIYNNYYGIEARAAASIKGNVIINNYFGIRGGSIIRSNTIANNAYGILGSGTFTYNNIHDNSEYSVHLGSSDLGFFMVSDVDATYNWWGTTDRDKISQTIYDYNKDFNLGKVNFVPFLTTPNPEAPTIPATLPTSIPPQSPSESPPSTPTPPAEPTPTPSQEPQQTEQFEAIVGATIVIAVLGTGLSLLIYLIKRK